MQALKVFLENEIIENRIRIQKLISDFEKEKISYRNIELNKNLQLILRKGGYEKLILIGFPFPLESYPLSGLKSKKDTLIFVFLRGEKVRFFQRKQLLQDLRKVNKVENIEINSINEFRKLTKIICNRFREIDYYDPYSFLGDSFIGLYLMNSFIKKYKLNLSTIYSENYKDLSLVGKSKGYIGIIRRKGNRLNILSDLLDNQWNRTKYIVKKMAEQSCPSIICGRDLIIIPEKGLIRVYHFNRKNILLKQENVEDYMNKCLLPFMEPSHQSIKISKIESKNIIINPFGSEAYKTVPEKIVFEVAKYFHSEYPNAKIILVAGFRNHYSHLLWVSKLRGLLATKGLNNVLFKNYGSFNEIKKDIERYKIALGLTADTSIAHLFNYLRLINITFYNLNRCDKKSPQSLASDSPLGFCRYGKIQYPLLFPSDLSKLCEGILGMIRYFLEGKEDTNWCNLIFNGSILTSQIGKKYRDLIRSNRKINPRYKLKYDQID
jgi:hypothetical protein